MSYVIHKQLIPKNNLIWVLKLNESDNVYSKLNPNDSVDEFENLSEAENKKNELQNSDPTGRIYKISIKNEDGSFSDL